nr:hypothetical protein [Tanacetum cinerariifolium]
QDAQRIAGVTAGQGGDFVGVDHADQFRAAHFGRQQVADLDAEGVGQAPGDGDGGIGFFAFDLRQHRLGDAGDARQVFQRQAA